MIELNFAISNNFAKTSTSSGENTHTRRKNTSSTLNDANKKHFEQLTMPVDARSHRYCQNYNLNHFLSNKRIWIRYHLRWSLFIVVQPSAPEKQSQLWKEFVKKATFECFHKNTHISRNFSRCQVFSFVLRFVPTIHWKLRG